MTRVLASNTASRHPGLAVQMTSSLVVMFGFITQWSGVASAQTQSPQAQTQPPPPSQTAAPVVEEIVVTGSRIASPNAQSPSPIQVVDSKEIELTGKRDVSDILYQLPQNFNNSIGQDFSSRTSGLTTAGGLTTADLRGLGPNRTLVLVNGRRLGQGDANTAIASPAPDLDQIPVALIERVDVVTGGASAVYGSDAIAGVVNFILKKNFEGLQVSYQAGENVHRNHSSYVQGLVTQFGGTPLTGTSYDGRNRAVDIVAGTNVAEGKGNITSYFSYLEQDGVPSSARDFGGCELFNNDPNGAVCGGSSNSNYFRLGAPVAGLPFAAYNVAGTSFVPRGSVPANPPNSFNSQQYIFMQRGDERYSAGFLAHETLNDFVQPYLELGYMNDKTHQEIAPSALFRDSNVLTADGNYLVNCSNPLLSTQERNLICTPAQIAADTANPGSASADLRIGRRNVEGNGRVSDFEHQNYRAVLGSKGDLGNVWHYDAYGQYFYTTLFNANNNFLNFQSITNALQVTNGPNGPVCISATAQAQGCVPYNIFNTASNGGVAQSVTQGVTQAALKYLYVSGTAYGTVTERTAHADITGELGKYGVKLPTANEGVAINFGYEHRSDKVNFQPDSGELSGLLSGFGGASVPIDNTIAVDEQFIELRAPLVQESRGAEDLVFDTGFRRSDYTQSGIANTRKFELQYAPIRDVRFRGTWQRAIRAPSIIELFNPQLVGQITFGPDPCAPPATASLANCLHTVSAAQAAAFTAAYNGGTIPQGTASQLSQLQGGNPNLVPEIGDSYTVGFNLTPTFLPSFTGSVDYYRINLKNSITSLPANTIMSDCLATGNPAFCSQIVRSPATFGLTGATPASGGYIIQTDVNIGAAKVSGIDVQGNYKVPLAGQRWGALRFALNGAWLQATTSTPFPGAHTYNCVGLFGSTCQTVNPRWRHNLRTSWDTPWNFEVSANWRFIGSVSQDNNSGDPSLLNPAFGGAPVIFGARIPSFSYIDLTADWNWKSVQLRGGIANLFDKDPPLESSEVIAGGAANTYETYDTLGRVVFLSVTAKF